jgi:hypothetical protein
MGGVCVHDDLTLRWLIMQFDIVCRGGMRETIVHRPVEHRMSN